MTFHPDHKPRKKRKKKPSPLKRAYIKPKPFAHRVAQANEMRIRAVKKYNKAKAKRYAPTGERKIFEQIWNERKRESFISKTPLGKFAYPYMFLHVLAKAKNKYPKFKLYKKNIVLGTWEEHHKWDKGSREELKKDPNWKKMFELEEELKQEYKNLPK